MSLPITARRLSLVLLCLGACTVDPYAITPDHLGGDAGPNQAGDGQGSGSSGAGDAASSDPDGGGTSSNADAGTSGANDGNAGDADGGGLGSGDAGTGASVSNACTKLLDDVKTAFANAGTLVDCHHVSGGAKVADSLMNVRELTIDNQGTSMSPCVEVRCDSSYAYVASNSLPHYDFVSTTPNALVEVPSIARVRLTPQPITQQSGADDASAVNGCTDAYDQFLFAPSTATTQEPSNLCALGTVSYLYDTPASGRVDYQRIPCLNAAGLMSSGVRLFGPNEAATPDPWGNPGYNYPNDLVSDSYGNGARLDLCGGHTADAMHYHAAKYACFEQDDARKPLRSYADATSDFDIGSALNDGCTEPSGIVGWSPDGYPIKGPCVCVARDAQGACSEVRKARSGWTYDGLNVWGSDANESTSLGKEGKTCNTDSDCCSGNDCHYSCSFTVSNDAGSPGGSVADKRCVLIDYSWCAHRFHTRADTTPDKVNFAYLDRCNGFEGPDGYAYHTTMTFPFLLGCYRGQVGAANTWFWSASGGMMGGGGGGGGGTTLPSCPQGQTSMCCGDGKCDGPETSTNCPADC